MAPKKQEPKKEQKKRTVGIEATAAEITSAVAGMREFIKLNFPIEYSSDLHDRLQGLRMAAEPLEAAKDQLVKAYAKKKRGQIVYGDKPGEVVLDPNRIQKFNAEFEKWGKQKRFVNIEPIRKSEIPHKVNGKELAIAGTVFDQLGPFLVP